jgi:O-succinylbenzoic acid--CoA ligase
VPDERLGEKVAALVQLRLRCSACPTSGGREAAALVQLGTEADLRDLKSLRQQQLAGYKVPELWSAVDHFPTNAMAKVIRTSLPALCAVFC